MTEKSDEPMQMTVFGDEVPMHKLPHLNCTNDEKCQAPVDAHLETCPIEQRLREEFSF